jgi:glycosyltransferase involved in cell wall biosynthesis
MTDREVFDHIARCRAVLFAPKNEDYGLVAVEAMRSRKPVITCVDSGGPTELINDGKNGFVLPPDPAAIAKRIDELAESEDLARRLGEQAYQDSLAISWDKVVERFTAPL